MPSALSHPAVPLALALALGPARVPPRLLALGIVAAILPDADALGLRLGIAYESGLGHRGASHSLLSAALTGLLAAGVAPGLRCGRWAAALFAAVCAASHGLLDMATNGGHGVALWWPFSEERLWWPERPIEASPLSLRRFFTSQGGAVILSELRWIWAPAALLGLSGWCWRRRASRTSQ
ncbi:metal-dependent hydrolase [Roseateles flavus]|uniref:Metal-dependent hydrolase n=1 Tax=Roseateles flavus TaxID=3149041 RepID=A0ABV0GKH2_9BURK